MIVMGMTWVHMTSKNNSLNCWKRDIVNLFNIVTQSHSRVYVSGPTPSFGHGGGCFSRLLSLRSWLSSVCDIYGVHFVDSFNLSREQRHLFGADGLHLNGAGARVVSANLAYSICHPHAPSPPACHLSPYNNGSTSYTSTLSTGLGSSISNITVRINPDMVTSALPRATLSSDTPYRQRLCRNPAVRKQRMSKTFQTVNHTKVLKLRGLFGGHLNIRAIR